MEFVRAPFPTDRPVCVDGDEQGRTNDVFRLQAGTYQFDLGPGSGYAPPSQTLPVAGTSLAAPLDIVFTQTQPALAAKRAAARKRPTRKAAPQSPRKTPLKKLATPRRHADGVKAVPRRKRTGKAAKKGAKAVRKTTKRGRR